MDSFEGNSFTQVTVKRFHVFMALVLMYYILCHGTKGMMYHNWSDNKLEGVILRFLWKLFGHSLDFDPWKFISVQKLNWLGPNRC